MFLGTNSSKKTTVEKKGKRFLGGKLGDESGLAMNVQFIQFKFKSSRGAQLFANRSSFWEIFEKAKVNNVESLLEDGATGLRD